MKKTTLVLIVSVLIVLPLSLLQAGRGFNEYTAFVSAADSDTAGMTSVTVSSRSELLNAIANASCGTEIVLSAGNYGAGFEINEQCNADNPLVIRNAARERPNFSGGSISLDGSYIHLSGLNMSQTHVRLTGEGHRLTRSVLEGRGSGTTLIKTNGRHIVLSYNEIYNFGRAIYVCSVMSCGGAASNQGTYIGFNYFRDQYGTPKNGNEAVTLLAESWGNSNVTIENNLFDNFFLENELISVKTSGNIIRGNTVINSPKAEIVTRQGNNNLIEGNYLAQARGINIQGDNNVVDNNYVAGGSGIRVSDGSITMDHKDKSCRKWQLVPQRRTSNGECLVPSHPAARNTVVTNNYVKNISVGCITHDQNYLFPAERTTLSNNHGFLKMCNATGTANSGGAPAKPLPRELTPADVGPSAGSCHGIGQGFCP